MYDHTKQYRCTIIRGKSKNEMDDLLLTYAQIIIEATPCSKSDFQKIFNDELATHLNYPEKKTLDNHRTEIAGKLFGMFYIDSDDFVYPSERTLKFMEDNDQPAFFKDMCFKMQFPNGMCNKNELERRITDKINVRPYSYVIAVLWQLAKLRIYLTKKEIGYYILNSFDVLQGKAKTEEIVNQIVNDKKKKISREIPSEGNNSAYVYQHINEQLNYLELANLISLEKEVIYLNFKEINALNAFIQVQYAPLFFDVYKYVGTEGINFKKLYLDWGMYYSKLSDEKYNKLFVTSIDSLDFKNDVTTPENTSKETNTVELGDEGERFVFEYEKKRVSLYNPRLTNKVLHLGKTKGLGFDIQSVIAEEGDLAEFVKYIEVKSTKRVTIPNIDNDNWMDTVNITRNEWIAAQQHKEFYSIYRVYFVRDNVILYSIDNPHEKERNKILSVVPLTYRVDFDKNAMRKIEVDNV